MLPSLLRPPYLATDGVRRCVRAASSTNGYVKGSECVRSDGASAAGNMRADMRGGTRAHAGELTEVRLMRATTRRAVRRRGNVAPRLYGVVVAAIAAAVRRVREVLVWAPGGVRVRLARMRSGLKMSRPRVRCPSTLLSAIVRERCQATRLQR